MALNLDLVNSRVDKALADNHRAETLVIQMSLALFLLGAAILVLAYFTANPYIAGGSLLFEGLLYWPIREILKNGYPFHPS